MSVNKRWVIKDVDDEKLITSLSKEINISKTISKLLVQRGIDTYEKAKQFFRPGIDDLIDPFLMKDMNQAVDRIGTAINRHERILVYGDYDVDGTTSVALIFSFFKTIYDNLGYYIPDRYDEGYGISTKGINYASENNYSLIIALDCGIKAVEKIKYASEKHIDFIICDHHMPGEIIPDAVAVLDPKRPDCDYPFKELSGCAVGFKLIQAFARIHGIPYDHLSPFLDLVAVSIASDIVPMVGENRALAFLGLQQLNIAPGIGLRSICKIAGLAGKEISISDVVFKIGPRINAAGRMENGSRAVELLIASNQKDALSGGNEIDAYNHQRRIVDQAITREALLTISKDNRLLNSKSLVLYNPNWHKGVIGIVASRLIESYYRPTVVLTLSNEKVTGSARSVAGFDLYQALESCSHLLENFGGHMYAAGLTLKKENIEAFSQCFEKVVSERITDEQMIPVVDIDAEISLKEITPNFVKVLKQFEPFGPGNMAPVFVARNVLSGPGSRLVGADGKHLKMDLLQKDQKTISAIAFNQSHNAEVIQNGVPFDVCFTIEENEFRGNINLQLNVKDINPAE